MSTPPSPPPLNRLRKEWREGRPTFGAIATIPSIATVQIMARSGFDWIIVDLEHGPIDLTAAHAMIASPPNTIRSSALAHHLWMFVSQSIPLADDLKSRRCH